MYFLLQPLGYLLHIYENFETEKIVRETILLISLFKTNICQTNIAFMSSEKDILCIATTGKYSF